MSEAPPSDGSEYMQSLQRNRQETLSACPELEVDIVIKRTPASATWAPFLKDSTTFMTVWEIGGQALSIHQAFSREHFIHKQEQPPISIPRASMFSAVFFFSGTQMLMTWNIFGKIFGKNIWSLWYYSMVPSQWCPYSMAYPPYFLRKIKLTQISELLDTCNLFLK